MLSRYLLLFFAIFYYSSLSAQFYDNGQDPFFVKWHLIETKNYKVLYSSNIPELAQLYANNLEKAHGVAAKTLDSEPRKLTVVLHNNTIISNGEVGWAPRRMNLYLVSGQDNFFQPWEQHLTTHETRHNFQMSKLNQGWTKRLGYLFGEIAAGAVLGLHLPLWFIEGDAVAFETGTGNAGRGRVADFSMGLKTQVNEKGIYSYPKAIFGSYKDYVPSRYELGYYLVTKGRQDFGEKIWDHTMNRVARKPLHPNPFSKGIKEITGLSEMKFYKKQMNDLRSIASESKIKSTKYANYFNPVSIGDGKTISLKTSYDDIPKIIEVDKYEKEQIIAYPGVLFNPTFAMQDSLLIWNEFNPTRFYNYNFNNIVLYDFKNKKRKYLTNKARVFHSRISPDKTQIVSVEVDEKINWSISFRNIQDGSLIKKIDFENQVITPEWSDDGTEIVFIEISSKGKSLGILNLEDLKIDWIFREAPYEISNPKFYDHYIIIKGNYQNVSNFFRYHRYEKKWELLTHATYGVSEGNVCKNKLFYSKYTSNGYRIDSVLLTGSFKSIAPEKYQDSLSEVVSAQEERIKFEENQQQFSSKKYSRFAHLLNFHSWSPVAMRVNQEKVGWGVSTMSQNVLSTSFLELGYQYHADVYFGEFYMKYDYKGFYPIIRVQNSLYVKSFNEPDTNEILRELNYRINRTAINVQVPMLKSRGAFTTNAYISVGSLIDYRFYKDTPYFTTPTSSSSSFSGAIDIYNLRKKSKQDLYPRWGQTFSVYYEKAPFDSTYNYNFAIHGKLYFPGILKNHSFRLYGGYQEMKETHLPYFNQLLYPRGGALLSFTQMRAARMDYSFPIIYPDLNIWEILYIKRLKANLFFDHGYYTDSGKKYTINATGFELNSDLHALRFIAPMQLGFRYSRWFYDSSNYFSLLFSINFDALY